MKFLTSVNEYDIQKHLQTMSSSQVIDQLKKYQYLDWLTFFDRFDVDSWLNQYSMIDTDVDYILSVGVGGSLHGIETIIGFLGKQDQWIFLGSSFSWHQIDSIKKKIQGKKIGIVVTSKLGTTLEPLIFLDLLGSVLNKAEWLVNISSHQDLFFKLKQHCNIPLYYISIDEYTGGRYSLLSQMGAFVLWVSQVDLYRIKAAIMEEKNAWQNQFFSHTASIRAVSRYLLQTQPYNILLEMMSTNQEKLFPFLSWSRQIFAESDGKNAKGLFISKIFYPQDAHSMEQIFTEGKAIFTETFYLINSSTEDVLLEKNTFSGVQKKSLAQINDLFIRAIMSERQENKTPINVYHLETDAIEELMKLIFCESVAVSLECLLLGVNPFNQPGVDGYKNRMKQSLF